MTAGQRNALLVAATAAPSADNQPVCVFNWAGNDLELRDAGQFTHHSPHRRVLAQMALGAVLTNLDVRAARLGLRLDTARLYEAAHAGELVARVSFSSNAAAAAVDVGLDDAITQRCTNRRPHFRGPTLATEFQTQMSREVAALPGVTLHWLDGKARRRKALTLIRLAETQRFKIEALHHELFESIRFDVGWSTPTAIGIPAGALALPLIERLGFPLLRHWRLQRAANLFGTHLAIGWRAAHLPCWLTPHLCAITATGSLSQAAVNAGRALQAAWLRATELGLAFQVFAASPLYALSGLQVVPPKIQANLHDGWMSLCGPDPAFVVFRMGHAPVPDIRTTRPVLTSSAD